MSKAAKYNWIPHSRETVFDNSFYTVWEDKVTNPAHKPGFYSIVHFKREAVGIIPLDKQMNTWIVGQFRYPMDSYEWEIPEGGADDNDPLATAHKELKEEAGLEAGRMDLILEMQLSNSGTDEVSFTFLARDLKEVEATPEETEQISIRKLPFSEVVAMVMKGEIRDAISVASILKLQRLIELNQLP
jgi:8-oxo-dGTP pyrophosphatase MutT (NUDIX family)